MNDTNAIIKNAIAQLEAKKQAVRASAYSAKFAELKPSLDAELQSQNEKYNETLAKLTEKFNAAKTKLGDEYANVIGEMKRITENQANKYADAAAQEIESKISQLRAMLTEE